MLPEASAGAGPVMVLLACIPTALGLAARTFAADGASGWLAAELAAGVRAAGGAGGGFTSGRRFWMGVGRGRGAGGGFTLLPEPGKGALMMVSSSRPLASGPWLE